MAQDDQSVANADGATVRADINNQLEAIVSLSSGATAPTTTWAYQWWADTTTGTLKQRNAANSAWVSVLALSTGLPINAGLADIAGLAVTDGNIIVGDGANWVAESGATARASLGAMSDTAVGFRASRSTAQTIANTTITKVQVNTEDQDTDGWYDPATNYRFTPLSAGTYLVLGWVSYGSPVDQSTYSAYIYKNGSQEQIVSEPASGTNNADILIAAFVEMDGSTDYLELYTRHNAGGNDDLNAAYFQAFRVGA